MKLNRRTVNSLVLVAAAALVAPMALAQNNVLRVVPHSNLAILDPIWTTAYMSRNHGYMIYDTLFGTDEKNNIKPQMVESWTESPDHRLWTFKLRKGLEFHDGKPVTSDDVVASLARWGKRDAMGSALMTFVERMDTPTPDSFRIFLREACGFVLEALGKPSSNVPFIMPKRVADTDPQKQIDDYTGSPLPGCVQDARAMETLLTKNENGSPNFACVPLHAPQGGNGPRITRALLREQVTEILERARSAGARIVKEAQDTFWGGVSGYFADLDGYYWEVAWGPMFEFTDDGALKPSQ